MGFVAGQVGTFGGRGDRFAVAFDEDASAVVLARITSIDGSGGPTGIAGEGYWLRQADIASITCAVFDLDVSLGDAIEPQVQVASSVLDTPETDIWVIDATGYNFRHSLPPEAFPTGGHVAQVEYGLLTTGGRVYHGVFRGVVRPISSS